MSTPIPGNNYTVIPGDSLSAISNKAYGTTDYYPLIYRANLDILLSGDPDVIFPDEEIFIPVLADFRKVPSSSDNEFALIIGNREVKVNSARILRTMDTASDQWEATIPWNPGEDPELDEFTKPYTYVDSFAFLNGEPIISGPLYGVTVRLSTDGKIKALTGNSFTADAVDSTMRPPYEKNNITLEDWAAELVAPFGIKAIFEESSGGKFDTVTAKPTETIFDHLAKLAAQRGLLISSDRIGNMLFLKAKTTGKPVATIEESPETFGAQGAIEYEAVFDGRKLFRGYKAIGQTPGGTSNEGISKDNTVNRPRFLTFQANDSLAGELQKAADWRRSKQLAETLTIPFPVSGWYDDFGELWDVNTLVTVKSATIFAPDGFTFLIKRVEFIYGNDGVSAMLSLVPPQVYSGEELVLPWE
jgi:prophage tail gpP-like protein